MSLTLICYVAVSSVAAAHAFPSSISTTASSDLSSSLSVAEMSPNCHQQKSDKAESKVISACKIFCAAMSNIIIDEFAIDQPEVKVGREITFLLQDISTLTFDMEPHPPK
jgi:hypothetical protein